MIKSFFYFSFGLVLGAILVEKSQTFSRLNADIPDIEQAHIAPVREMASQESAPLERKPILNQEVTPIYGTATLIRQQDGHYWAEAEVNHAPIKFMVDTGASLVALTRPDAQKIGIDPQERDYKGFAQTPNGKVRIAQVTLKEITLGNLRIRDVPAVVIDQKEGTSLLGMTFLNRLRGFEFHGTKMIMNE